MTSENEVGIVNVIEKASWGHLAVSLGMSGRELEVLIFLVEGKSRSDIAATLGISPHTVHTYIDRLYRKLGARSRAEAAVKVLTFYIRYVMNATSPVSVEASVAVASERDMAQSTPRS